MCNNKIISIMSTNTYKSLIGSLWILIYFSLSFKNYETHLIDIHQNKFINDHYINPLSSLTHHKPFDFNHYKPSDFNALNEFSTVKKLTPDEFMVDVTNDFTFRILYYHSVLNRNNFAFSPCSLLSILIALYEASAGHSNTQLKNAILLPNNMDIIRIGYRDIHRRLRTYFFRMENPLKGLSLNRENITITHEYETILKFYGYDLSIDMISITEPPMTTTTMQSVVNTTMTNYRNQSQIDSNTTRMPKDLELETMSFSTIVPLSNNSIETESSTTVMPNTSSTLMTTIETTDRIKTETSTLSSEVELTTMSPTLLTQDVALEMKGNNEAAELISSQLRTQSKPISRIRVGHVLQNPNAKLQMSRPLKPLQTKYLPSINTNNYSRYTKRDKRHLIAKIRELDSNVFVNHFNKQTSFENSFPEVLGKPIETADFYTPDKPRYKPISIENSHVDVINHVFYVDHEQLIHTTFKVYNAVLYYKYFDFMNISVLELELDASEYNLMIFLPDLHVDLISATVLLKTGPTLRMIRKLLRPRWVQAIIPDFKLHGTIFLTNDLQNMGIYDIFEPNRADLHLMTNENRVYVKHIEQLINVNIHTNPTNKLKRNYDTQLQPIQVSVSHPFLFFIIDRDLDVAVMAGRMINPLNVRIQ